MGTLIDLRDPERPEPLPDLEPADPFVAAQIRFTLDIQNRKRRNAEDSDAS